MLKLAFQGPLYYREKDESLEKFPFHGIVLF